MMYWVSMKVCEAFIGAAIVNRPTLAEACQAAGNLAEPYLCDKHSDDIEMAVMAIPTGQPVPAEAVERFLDDEQLKAIFGELRRVKIDVADGTITRSDEHEPEPA